MNFITVPLFFGCNFFFLGFVQKEPHSLAISERCELFGYFHMNCELNSICLCDDNQNVSHIDY